MKKKQKTVSVMLIALLLLVTFAFAIPAAAITTYQVGDQIQFGNYPQTRVDETPELKAAAEAATWRSYGYFSGTGGYSLMRGENKPGDYMKFADFFCGKAKYRAVRFSNYRPRYTSEKSQSSSSYQDEQGYTPNQIYYFKYEPLTWRILDPSNGFVVCEKIIDSQAIQNTMYYLNNAYWQTRAMNWYSNNYATSDIRDWLNDDFFKTAFTKEQQDIIKSTEIKNEAYSADYARFNGEKTTDKVFLLSYEEGKNPNYRFAPSFSTHDTARRTKGTDYAKCQGLAPGDADGNNYWWLRTPSNSSTNNCCVECKGYVNIDKLDYSTCYGIRPACCLSKLGSDTTQSDNLFSGPTSTTEPDTEPSSEPISEPITSSDQNNNDDSSNQSFIQRIIQWILDFFRKLFRIA